MRHLPVPMPEAMPGRETHEDRARKVEDFSVYPMPESLFSELHSAPTYRDGS